MILIVEIICICTYYSLVNTKYLYVFANIYVDLQAGCIIMIKTKHMITDAKFEFID